MGLVIRALDKDLEREVAIKVLPAEWADSSEARRFVEEARITGRLEHPNIVPVYELGSDPRGARYLSMKLVQGETLDEALTRAGAERLSPEHLADFLQVFVKLCDAVSFAHSQGIIHRDLKPSNVMIGDFGEVYVMDWGVALDTRRSAEAETRSARCAHRDTLLHGARAASRDARSRQRANRRLRPRRHALPNSDRTPAARRCFGDSPARSSARDRAARRRSSRDLTVPLELSRIVMKALAIEPEDRYASVSDLKGDIQRFERGAWHLPHARYPAGMVIFREGEPGDSALHHRGGAVRRLLYRRLERNHPARARAG